MISFNKVAKLIFSIIKGIGREVELYDVEGKTTMDPERTRRFFARPDHFMVTLDESGDDSAIILNLSVGTDIEELQKFIESLKSLATRYNLLWRVSKFSKEISPKDFAYRAEIEKQRVKEAEDEVYDALSGVMPRPRSAVLKGIMKSYE